MKFPPNFISLPFNYLLITRMTNWAHSRVFFLLVYRIENSTHCAKHEKFGLSSRVPEFCDFCRLRAERLYSSSSRETGCNAIRCQISTSQQKKLTMKLECPSTPYLATIYFGHALEICKVRLGFHCLVRNTREIKVTS